MFSKISNIAKVDFNNEDLNKLLDQIKEPVNHTCSTIWLSDVDVNSEEAIGLELIKNVLCITIASYEETADTRTYNVISQFAVDREALQSALDCLDIIEN